MSAGLEQATGEESENANSLDSGTNGCFQWVFFGVDELMLEVDMKSLDSKNSHY